MEFFVTHIENRIPLANPHATVFFIYFSLLVILFLSTSKSQKKQHFLDLTQTQQLRGIAILLIMIGHLGSNVLVKNNSIPRCFNNCGVYLFLFLSGYGLMRAHQLKHYTLLHFMKRRVNRIFIPYWITTVLFLVLDYFLLSETYSLKLITLTTFGLNTPLKIQLLDYVRWFITLLLFFYCIFFIATRFKNLLIQLLILVVVPITACYLNFFFEILTPYNPSLGLTDISPTRGGWNPWNLFILPFPLGFLFGAYSEKLDRILPTPGKSKWRALLLGAVFLSVYLLIGKTSIQHSFYGIFYSSAMINISRMSLAFCTIAIFVFFSSFNIYSRILYFTGSMSYELYLLHDAFLVKYDFILFRLPIKYSFLIFLGAIYGASYFLKKFSAFVTSKRIFSSEKTEPYT